MKTETILGLLEVDLLNIQGKVNFPQVVQRLLGLGVERYHVDYARDEITFYLPDGASLVLPKESIDASVAMDFSSAALIAALREVQAGAINYPTFVAKTRAAGCVGYTAHLAGRRVVYSGRNGDCHVEHFPAGKP